jgi:hypothetical protein
MALAGANLFHLHIPKTAGTSLRAAFERGESRVLAVNSNFVYDPGAHSEIDLFSGHAGFRAVEASPALRGRVVTILRDPEERALSYYHHLIREHDAGREVSYRTRLAARYPLRDFLAVSDHSHLLTDMRNAVTWQLVCDSDLGARMKFRDEQPKLTDADLIARAKDNLASFLVVGLQSRMDLFTRKIQAATGVAVALREDNVNPGRPPLDSLDAQTRRRLREWLELDLAVYDWAQAEFGRE